MPDFAGFGRESVVSRCGAGTLTSAGPPSRGPAPAPAPAAEKYEVTGSIGAGGMGEVLLVQDRDLRREVAMKVMKRELAILAEHRLKFVAEAQATSQLEHPGIPPVHDLGLTADGKPYFTMKLVKGRTLRDVLQDLLVGRPEVRREYSLHRLVTVLERMCEALHFAHEKGVLHRDLKPENIMLGDFGEVHVMDWGIARVRGEEVDPEDAVGTAGTDAGLMTMDGAIKGTVPYMSPEQAMGRVSKMDRRSDLWSMGCILYEMLTLHFAFEGEHLLSLVRKGEYPAVRTRNPKRVVPEDLALLCEKCLKVDPAERPASAKELGAALRAWLDGTAEKERRHREAEELAAKGRAAAARYEGLKREVVAAEKRAEEMAGHFKAWQPLAEKAPAIEARERVQATRRAVVKAFAEATKWLEAALVAEESNATARSALAALWRGRLSDAEARGDREDAGYALDMVARYDDGTLARVVAGDGSLCLTSVPPGAEVILHLYEDRLGVLHEGPPKSLGRTPVGPVDLPMGSYLCVLGMPGFRDVRYPVHISRNRSWTGHVRMRTDDEIGDGFVLVPGGPFVFGEGKETRTLELPGFAIARYPVTLGEYGEFLAAAERNGGPVTVDDLLPRMQDGTPLFRRNGAGEYIGLLAFMEEEVRARLVRERGADFWRLLPVMLVSWNQASAYCAWKSHEVGGGVRLPTAEEREKAARGVDGRPFPWGTAEDASLAKCRDSRNEPPEPEPVDTYPHSVSVYGMANASGAPMEWTGSWADRTLTAREVRGCSWISPAKSLRVTSRGMAIPAFRNGDIGFRAARDLP